MNNIYRRYPKTTIAIITTFVVMIALHLWVPHPLFNKPTSTVAVDCDGHLLGARIAADEQWRFPQSDSISDKLAACITNYEDRRFYYHPGIDLISLCRAAYHDIRAGHVVEGGSTLTMQLARMARGNQSRTLLQKVAEMLWAIDIELSYSKKDILHMYAANAPMGGNIVGIEAAAWRYFGRSASDLSWAENATLAVLPNSPALIHVGRNRDALKAKRDQLLKTLCDRAVIDKQTYELSISEPLPEIPYSIPNNAPHLIARIGQKQNGQLVTTTIRGSLQKQVQKMADRYSARYKSNYIDDIAVIVAEVETGNVIAYIGNSSMPSPTQQVDLIQSERSTGSLLKPFLYAAMLTDGEITPSMLISDTPLNINGFTPQNYSKSYNGTVHADMAIKRSLNVPLVRMLSQHNTGRFMTLLKWLGMTTLHFNEDHYGASLILGGAEGTLWDMTGMYASLSRRLKHYTQLGNTYDENDIHPLSLSPTPHTPTKTTDKSMISASAIWYAYEAMSGLNRPEEEADWQMFSSMKRIAWKTGTSWGGRDAWAIGTTSKYTVGVWVGNATGEGRAGMTGVGLAAPLMLDVFSVLDDSPWFTSPLDDMEEAIICRKSGCIASQICQETDTILIPHNCIETKTCPYCRLVHLTVDGRWQVNSSCESINSIQTVSRFILPPAQELYYKSHNADYISLPPMRPDCMTDNSSAISVIYPEHEAIVSLPRDINGKVQHIVMKAACSNSETSLYWHIDDEYLGQTQGSHEMIAMPKEGPHVLTVIDSRGNKRAIEFEVR